jgi:hypothetical protein
MLFNQESIENGTSEPPNGGKSNRPAKIQPEQLR